MPDKPLNKAMEDLLHLSGSEMKERLSAVLDQIQTYGIGKLLAEEPGFMAALLNKLKQAGAAPLLNEIPAAADRLAEILWEGVSFRASGSKEMKSLLEKAERDFHGNIEASDSPFQSHFVMEKGRIYGGAGLLHFRDEDFRFMGPTEVLMDLLTGDLFMGFGNLRLQTAGHPGWVKRIAPVVGQIGRLLKGD